MARHRIRPAPALAGLLAVTGALHFAAPESFDAIVPRVLPGPPRRWTYLSGAAELAVAVAVAAPRTRRLGGVAAAALFVGVFPANVQMALDSHQRPGAGLGPAAATAAVDRVGLARLPRPGLMPPPPSAATTASAV